MSDVTVTWVQEEQFVATGAGGHSIVLDAPSGRTTWHGFKPSELLLAGVGSCSGVDVVTILRKKRQHVSGVRITVHGEQASTPPNAFEDIHVHYDIRGKRIEESAVIRAIQLAEEKYCSVIATVRGVARITTSFTIIEDQPIVDDPQNMTE